MNFLALEYFLEIERAGSFSAAARKLFVSQQSLSESIQKLEQEVGAALFVRKRPLVLTEAGLRFSQGARAILEIRTGMLRDIAALGERQRQELAEKGGLALLRQIPFILLYDRKGDEIPLTRQLFRRAGFSPVVGFQSDNGDLNTSMCLRGFGACSEKEYIETALYLISTPNTGLFFVYCSIYCGFVGASEPAHCGLSLICRLNMQ